MEPELYLTFMRHGRSRADQSFPRPAFRNPYQGLAGTGESEVDWHDRAALRHVIGASVPLNGQGIWFECGDAGYYQTRYAPANHHWMMKTTSPVEIPRER